MGFSIKFCCYKLASKLINKLAFDFNLELNFFLKTTDKFLVFVDTYNFVSEFSWFYKNIHFKGQCIIVVICCLL